MKATLSSYVLLGFLLGNYAYGLNFPFEEIQLRNTEVAGHPDFQFGGTVRRSNLTCKAFPGDPDWPSVEKWASLNSTLGGVLIKATPLGSVCYRGSNFDSGRCDSLLRTFRNSSFIADDPASVGTTWAEGNSCIPTSAGNGTCIHGGLPAFVVNASTVRHIQIAVNFARNNNIRLIIKNTGHDFLGRSVGAGSLSIWVHHLKHFEYLAAFTYGSYRGKAARVGAGLQAFDLNAEMARRNITLVVPGGTTVGVYGGYTQGGGHSVFTSYYGLGADQVLSLQVVTADGRFITADQNTNSDLFFALRGGGAGNWGVVTSAIVKVYESTSYSENKLSFETGKNSSVSTQAFWQGVAVYHRHVTRIIDQRGQGFNYIRVTKDGGFNFQNSIWMPKMSPSELDKFSEPLYKDLRAVGIPITSSKSSLVDNYGARGLMRGAGDNASNVLIASRLFPRENLEDEELFNATMRVIRKYVEEGGYTFHSNNYAPTEEVAGYPDNAVTAAFRNTVSHATAFDTRSAVGSKAEIKASFDRFQKYIQPWRDVSPTAGCYANEASVMEPNWQWAFYGEHYPRLQRIKRSVDPWGLFYATTGVGSEEWEVRVPGELKSQEGKLCKLARSSSTWQWPEENTDSRLSRVGKNRQVRRRM